MREVIIGGPTPFIPGSEPVGCADCGTTVWLAPTGQEIAREGREPVCASCALRAIGAEGGLIGPLTPEQRAEIRATRQ